MRQHSRCNMGKGDHISAGGSENRDTLSRIAGRLSDSYWGGGGVPGCAVNPRELGDQLPSRVAHGDDGDPGEEQLSRKLHNLVDLLSWEIRASVARPPLGWLLEGGCTWAQGESRRELAIGARK